MSKKITILFLLLSLIFFTVSANPLSKLYQEDDPILQDIYDLSVAAGILPTSSSVPISGYDLFKQTEIISQHLNNDYLDSINKELTSPFAKYPFSISVTATPEFYANIDKDANEWDWMIRYNQRNPFLYFEAEALLTESIYSVFSYDVKRILFDEEFTGFNTNYPYQGNTHSSQLEEHIPHTAFLGISRPNYTFALGRDVLQLGSGNTGNLTLGNHVPYHDFLHFSTNNKYLKYTFLAIPMNEIGEDGQAKYPDYKGDMYRQWLHNSNSRTFLIHRLEMNIGSKVRFAMTEGTLFYASRFDLRMLNPMMFMHNFLNLGEVNNSMSFEIQASVAPKWLVQGQFFLDQFLNVGEALNNDTVPPNAYAALLALNYVDYLPKGKLKGFIEGVYVSPHAYLRFGDETSNFYTDDEANQVPPPYQWNLDLVHAVSMRGGKGGTAVLGYKDGPDAIVGALGASYESFAGYGCALELKYIVQGTKGLIIEEKSQALDLGIENLKATTPYGTPTHRFIVSPSGYYTIPKVGIKIFGRLDWINKWYKEKYSNDLQVNIGFNYSLKII